MLAFLGWNPGTEQEIFSLEELVESFSLERVIRSGAKFNAEKAKWFNQEYLRMKSNASLAEEFSPILEGKGISAPLEYIEKVCSLIKERAHFVSDFWELSDYLFTPPTSYDSATVAKFWNPETKAAIAEISKVISSTEPFTKENLDTALHNFITERSLPMGKVMNSLRLSLVGASKGPGVTEIIALLGKSETLHRIEKAIATL